MRYTTLIFKILATVIHIWRSLVPCKTSKLNIPTQSYSLTNCSPCVTTEAAMCHSVAQASAWCLITTVLSSYCPAQMLHRQWKDLHWCMAILL